MKGHEVSGLGVEAQHLAKPKDGRHGRLFLVPVPLGAPGQVALSDSQAQLSAQALQVLPFLKHFVVENAKSARSFLKPLVAPEPIQSIDIQELDKHGSAKGAAQTELLLKLLAPAIQGQDIGLLSESGCPAVADPGALLVRQAHALGIQVCPLIGPSSVLLALMAGGLGGQRFAFHGYLPSQPADRLKSLQMLEKASTQQDQTQLWIETPYRNSAMIDAMAQALKGTTLVSLAIELTSPKQQVFTQPMSKLKQLCQQARDELHPLHPSNLKQSMVVFSLLAQ